MQKIETTEKTFVYTNGVINVYQADDGYRYVAYSGSTTLRDTGFTNVQCARANAYLAMQKRGIELKARPS